MSLQFWIYYILGFLTPIFLLGILGFIIDYLEEADYREYSRGVKKHKKQFEKLPEAIKSYWQDKYTNDKYFAGKEAEMWAHHMMAEEFSKNKEEGNK